MSTIAATESKILGNVVSDEHAIQCVEDLTQESDESRRFIFRLLMKEEQYFDLIYAEAEIPKHYKGIIIAFDNTGKGYPKQYRVDEDNVISFGGGLRKKPHYQENSIVELEFEKVFHYLFKNSEIEELGSDVPNMLKELFKENNANVFAYFEFKH